MADDRERVLQKIEHWKSRLLDLSKANRLLYFRPSKTGTLRLVAPNPAALYKDLVADERTLTFYLPEGEEPTAPALVNGDVDTLAAAPRRADVTGGAKAPGRRSPLPGTVSMEDRPLRRDEVRADIVDPQKLWSVLYRLRLRARTAIQEQGVNTLFVVFGFLEWKEAQQGGEVVSSPLVLVPVELEQESTFDPCRLRMLEEDIMFNPTLIERLRHDFNFTLDPPAGDLAELTLTEVLDHVRAAVPDQQEWRVVSDVYLGLFSFLKLVMYKDLEANTERLAAHPVVRALAGNPSDLPSLPTDLPGEHDELDDKLPPQATFHVLDADASQLRVLIAAKRGVNLTIQGPPGTGKSQTIANLIAECLADGKKVLFVSQKMAALQMVHKRLQEVRLTDFCLEVHSHRANKRAVIKDLERALYLTDAPAPDGNALVALSRLEARRRTLNEYVRALHDANTPIEMSAFQAHGEAAKRALAPDLRFSFAGAGSVTWAQLADCLDAVQRITALGHVLLGQEDHPWRGCLLTGFSLRIQGDITTHLGCLRRALAKAAELGERLAARCGLSAPATLEKLRWLSGLLDLVVKNPLPPAEWFALPSLTPLMESAQAYLRQSQDYYRRRDALLGIYQEALFNLDVKHLRERLTARGKPALDLLLTAAGPAPERASALHAELEKRVMDLLNALDRLLAGLPTLAARAGLPLSLRLAGASDICRLVELALRDPRPLREWLHRPQLLACQALADKARKHARTLREDGTPLLAAYDEAIVEVGPRLAAQFAERYSNFLRALRPGYWKDMALIRRLHRERRRHSTAEALEALERATRVAAARAWLADHEEQLAGTLGHHYAGEATDWDSIVRALEDTRAIVDHLAGRPFPLAFAELLVASGPPLRALAHQHRAAASAVERTERELEWLATVAAVEKLVPTEATVDAALAELRERVQDWLDSLQDFWAAEGAIRQALRDGQDRSVAQLVADLDEAGQLLDMEEALQVESAELKRQFGYLFAGLKTDWQGVLAALGWTNQVCELFAPQHPPETFVERVAAPASDRLPTPEERRTLDALLAEVDEELPYLWTLFPKEAVRVEGLPVETAPLVGLIGWIDERLTHVAGLEEWLDYNRARQQCQHAGLGDFLIALDRDRSPPDTWKDAFLKRFYQLWLDDQYAKAPALGEFRGVQHQQVVAQFRQLDRQALQLAAQRVRYAVFSRRPPITPLGSPRSEPAILLHETQKQRRHKPIRRLFREIPTLLLVLKPCLMMSPLSVSQYLDAERIYFDVVIFDEASQVLPEDAVGVILRARQVVIAGDEKQLPPTRFFAVNVDEAVDEDEEEGSEVFESILNECSAIGLPPYMLQWHYRSRDERLIAFSNKHFYDGRLLTFPSAQQDAAELGVQFVHMPDGVYDRAGTRTNRLEAGRVVDLIIEHAERSPQRSLGVVAFSEAQMLAILQELESRRRLRRDLDRFFSEDRPEPFFVKNLESVQGDERDVVFFSVGYGKDAAGNLSLNFGPLNRSGGERRLNVAVTRARYHVKLVSSILPEDIDLNRTSSEGVRLLRDYMLFARDGPEVLGAIRPGDGEAESPFEEAVAEALERRGLVVNRQLGVAHYRIDLAVADPSTPGRYLLGIECDGRTYHSSKTARDRDRLRQQVLENLGWRVHRIWSPDWLKDPDREADRVLAAIEQARNPAPPADDGAHPGEEEVKPSAGQGLGRPPDGPPGQKVAPPASRVKPYERAKLPRYTRNMGFYLPSNPELAGLVARCVAVEGPVHFEAVARRVAGTWSITQLGLTERRNVRRAIDASCQQGKVELRSDFLWPPGMVQPPVRAPASHEEPRPVKEIALEEVAEAALLVVEQSFSLPRDELIVQTARVLGYERTSRDVADRVAEAIALLERSGCIKVVDDQVFSQHRWESA